MDRIAHNDAVLNAFAQRMVPGTESRAQAEHLRPDSRQMAVFNTFHQDNRCRHVNVGGPGACQCLTLHKLNQQILYWKCRSGLGTVAFNGKVGGPVFNTQA